MKVKFAGCGVLVNEKGEMFTDNGYGNLVNMDTGELFKVSQRDENDNIVEIEEL